MKKIYQIKRTYSPRYRDFGPRNQIPHRNVSDRYKYIRDRKVSMLSFQNGEYGDMAQFGLIEGFSEKFINVLKLAGINNFKTFPIRIEDKDSPKYFFIELKNRKLEKYSEKNNKKRLIDFGDGYVFSVYFCYDDIGDLDLFTVEDTYSFFCTEKIKNIIEKAKLRNVKFKELISM